jgi:hypothetical protein
MPTPTAPSENSAGAPAAAKRPSQVWPTPAAVVHDLIGYAGIYLALLLADTPAGGGWDALIAAAPIAGMQLLRKITANL